MLKDKILGMMPPYPTDNDQGEREAGYSEAMDNLIIVLDKLEKRCPVCFGKECTGYSHFECSKK